MGPPDDGLTPPVPPAVASEPPDEATVLSARRKTGDGIDDATALATRRTLPAGPGDDVEVEEHTVLSVRRASAPDDATVLSARRTAEPVADELDDTVLGPRRTAAPADPDDLDATSIAGRRPTAPEPFPGTSAPSDTHTAGGTTIEDRTDETVLRSVRRTAPAGPPEGPDASPAVTRRTAYVPGEEASDRRAPRASGPVIADRAPVAPPSSVTPPPALDGTVARRRRDRRRLLIAAAVTVVVIAAAVVALVLLLT